MCLRLWKKGKRVKEEQKNDKGLAFWKCYYLANDGKVTLLRRSCWPFLFTIPFSSNKNGAFEIGKNQHDFLWEWGALELKCYENREWFLNNTCIFTRYIYNVFIIFTVGKRKWNDSILGLQFVGKYDISCIQREYLVQPLYSK